eukprot:gene7633-17197_t
MAAEQVENGASEEITTIFINGLPDDMQPREFDLLFKFSPGWEFGLL